MLVEFVLVEKSGRVTAQDFHSLQDQKPHYLWVWLPIEGFRSSFVNHALLGLFNGAFFKPSMLNYRGIDCNEDLNFAKIILLFALTIE